MTRYACIIFFMISPLIISAQTNTFPPTGSVGIGTTNPQSLLHVISPGVNINEGNNSLINSNSLVIQANTGGRPGSVGAQLEFALPSGLDGNNIWGQGRIITVAGNQADGSAVGKMILGTRRYFDKTGSGIQWYYGDDITIDGTGQVGVGTTTPEARLQIINVPQNSDGNTLILGHENETNLRLGYNSEYSWIQAHGGKPLFINELGNDLILNKTGGNVGIATTNPASKLHIEGGQEPRSVQTLFPASYTEGTPVSGLRLTWYNDSWDIRAHRSNSTPIEAFSIARNGAEYFRISGAGDVGIGTNSPAEKLSVNGKIRAKEIKVEITNWPDYVFTESHPVSQISDLEMFIKANHHLPDIPNAEQVQKEGIELGQMNSLLLKKIEELTLYIIEQNKRNAAQDALIRKLEVQGEQQQETITRR